MLFKTFAVALGVSGALASPFPDWHPKRQNSGFLDGHDWIPADQIDGAVRSPCPMLNTLANHGFL
jgi:hypothetical protein